MEEEEIRRRQCLESGERNRLLEEPKAKLTAHTQQLEKEVGTLQQGQAEKESKIQTLQAQIATMKEEQSQSTQIAQQLRDEAQAKENKLHRHLQEVSI